VKRLIDEDPIQLTGFNNLTKSLKFNLYDFCIARNEYERQAYVNYIQDKYSAPKVTRILRGICEIIEAKILAVSDQAYQPWGASSLVLMSDLKGGGTCEDGKSSVAKPLDGKPQLAMHLDKSHICAHTYPDFRAEGTVCSFRIDIDISTCGEISPLRALNYIFDEVENDVAVIDYSVRGFTRDANGRRVYMDHEFRSIQDYIDDTVIEKYECVDLALQSDNIWQTKMLRTQIDKQSYFLDSVDLEEPGNRHCLDLVKKEMRGLLYMWPD